MFIPAAAGFRHPVSVPGSQQPQLLASEFTSAQGHSAAPFVGTDHFTHTGMSRSSLVPQPTRCALSLRHTHIHSKSLVPGHFTYCLDWPHFHPNSHFNFCTGDPHTQNYRTSWVRRDSQRSSKSNSWPCKDPFKNHTMCLQVLTKIFLYSGRIGFGQLPWGACSRAQAPGVQNPT